LEKAPFREFWFQLLLSALKAHCRFISIKMIGWGFFQSKQPPVEVAVFEIAD